MAQSRPPITGFPHTLPFDSLSPTDLEQLCLRLIEREGYERAEISGAAGNERGCDIVARREGKRWAFYCGRVRRLGSKQALAKVEHALALPESERPVGLVFIVTCEVSAQTRRRVHERCAGQMECCFWAGAELDGKVKRHPDILERFFGPAIAQRVTAYNAEVSGSGAVAQSGGVAAGAGGIAAGRDIRDPVIFLVENTPAIPYTLAKDPELRLKLFPMGRAPHAEDEMCFRQQDMLPQHFRFGLVLENIVESTVAREIDIRVECCWRGDVYDDMIGPEFEAPSTVEGWKTEISRLRAEYPAVLTFEGAALRCPFGHPKRWQDFRLTLHSQMRGYLLLQYTASSAQPPTRNSGELRINLL